MNAFIGPILSGVVGAIMSAVGIYVAITNRLTRLETMIDQLREETRRHNEVIERTYKLEADAATSWKRYDELTARVERLEGKQ